MEYYYLLYFLVISAKTFSKEIQKQVKETGGGGGHVESGMSKVKDSEDQ